MKGKIPKQSVIIRNIRSHTLLLGCLILLSWVAVAQTGFSGLRGNVTDQSGAVIAGAEITLTEPSTGGVVRTAKSDDQGNFEFPNLKPGTYQVKSEKAGFRAFTATDVQLDASQIRRFDIRLTVGATQDQVEVRAGVAAIQTEGGSISNTVDTKKVADVPLIETYPSPYSLFATMPSVQGRDWGINIAGQNEDQMSIQVNGVKNDRAGDQNNNLRFVQEATVLSVNATADSSRVVSYNLTTKRGANAWHGMAFYQHYNSVLNATPHPEPKKQAYIQHDWQAEIGGPIWRDHTFFFVSWFRNEAPLGSYHQATVPTTAMWNGDVSGLGTVIDPQTGSQFPNNVIPADRISPVAKALQAYYPAPNIGDPNVYSDNNFGWHHPYTSPLNYVGNWPYFRLDHNLTSNNTIFASWIQRLTPFAGAGSIPSIPWTRMRDNRQLSIVDTHIFNPRVLNTFRFGYSDDLINDGEEQGGLEPPKGGDMIAALGIEGVNPGGYNTAGGPTFNTDDRKIAFGPSAKWSNKSKTFSFEDSLSYQVGRHLWKFGAEISAFRSTDDLASDYGSFDFNGMFTGVPFADFLLGLPSTSRRKDPLVNRTITAKELGFYFQDTFKVSSRLTLDYGLRWDYFSLPTYTDGLMYNFDPIAEQIIVPESKLADVNPAYSAAVGMPVVAGQPTPSADHGNFRPRIAVSYLLGQDFVVRGGYGQFTERFGHDYSQQASNQGGGPFERLAETFYNDTVNGQPLFSFPNPFPTSGGVEDTPSQWVVILPNQWENGTIHQFNASVEKEIAGVGLRASYIGSRSRGMNYMGWRNENLVPASSVPYDPINLPFQTLSEVYRYHSDGAANYNALQVEAARKQGWFTFDAHYTFAKSKSNIQQTDDSLNPTKTWGPDANLHDHMVTVTTRWELPFGHGRQHLNQLPKAVDAILGGWAVQTVSTFGSGSHLTPFIYGLSDFANNNWNAWTPDVIPGADPNLDGDQRTQERYFNTAVTSCSDPLGCGLGSVNNTPYVYSQLGAFKVPGCTDADPLCLNSSPENIGRLGNAQPGTVNGPGIHVHHLSLAKSFAVTERVRTTFVTEISNLFNRPHFWAGDNWDPGTWIQDPGAGKLTWALPDNDPFKGGHRLISFKLRVEF